MDLDIDEILQKLHRQTTGSKDNHNFNVESLGKKRTNTLDIYEKFKKLKDRNRM